MCLVTRILTWFVSIPVVIARGTMQHPFYVCRPLNELAHNCNLAGGYTVEAMKRRPLIVFPGDATSPDREGKIKLYSASCQALKTTNRRGCSFLQKSLDERAAWLFQKRRIPLPAGRHRRIACHVSVRLLRLDAPHVSVVGYSRACVCAARWEGYFTYISGTSTALHVQAGMLSRLDWFPRIHSGTRRIMRRLGRVGGGDCLGKMKISRRSLVYFGSWDDEWKRPSYMLERLPGSSSALCLAPTENLASKDYVR